MAVTLSFILEQNNHRVSLHKKTSMHKPLIVQGWLRALIYFLLLLAIAFGVQVATGSLIESAIPGTFNQFIVSYILVSILFLLYTWVSIKFVDRGKFSDVGLTWKLFRLDGAMGLFTALAILGIGSLMLALMQQVVFTGIETDYTGILIQLGLMVIVAFTEEVTFRGYILRNLMLSMPPWVALLISSMLFALVHSANPNVTVLPVVNVFFAGLLLGINYIFTRNLWFGILLHFAWNFGQGAVLGYEVSGLDTPHLLQQYVPGTPLWTGGEFGFEGSLICTILLVLAIGLWWWLFSHKYKSAI
jgi:membrane protease YdiL (CAAX protease family)